MDNQTLKETGEINIPDIKVIPIIGEIEGHLVEPDNVKTTKYEHVIPMLVEAAQADDTQGILLILNTMGGDVEAGLAISELVAGLGKPSVSLVLGGGHSIGVPLAVCTDYSFIAGTASMTVHPIRTNGLIITAQETFEYYNKMQERIIRFICENSKVGEDHLNEIMFNKNQFANDTGSVLIGTQAVNAGLIDEVGGFSDAVAKLRWLISEWNS